MLICLICNDHEIGGAHNPLKFMGDPSPRKKTMPSKPYQGHHCWNCWNVSLWIANDEGLYRMAIECLDRQSLNGATMNFLAGLSSSKTPDGAPYTKTSVKRALSGLRS